jgi:hypothetical protein
MPEPKEFPSVHEMEEDEEDEDPQPEQQDDSATITTSAEQRQLSIEPESFVSAPSSPKQRLQTRTETPPPEPRVQRTHKAPAKFDPGSYVSAQQEAESQSHVTYTYKADTTMWSESAVYVEPQNYEEAVNDPL